LFPLVLIRMIRCSSGAHFRRGFAISSALVAALVLAGCGGGSNDETPKPPVATFVVAPASFSAFSSTPNTVTVTAGTGPFTVTSSDSAVLPVPAALTGATLTFSAAKVATPTPVTLTFKDATAATATVVVTVTPTTISGPIVFTPPAASRCKAENSAGISAATFCAGDVGTAAVTLRDGAGAPIANRPVMVEVRSTGASVARVASGAPYSSDVTVNTDASGLATVSLRADSNNVSEAVFVRATDSVSSHRMDTWMSVLQQTSGATPLSAAPATAGILGTYTNECSVSRREFVIYGGKAPYAITLPSGATITVAGTSGIAGATAIVDAAGGTFVINQPTTTTCAAINAVITITDAAGVKVSPTFAYGPGGATKPTGTTFEFAPAAITLTATPASAHCSSSATRIAVRGGTAPYVVSASIPQVSATLSGTDVDVSYVSDSRWKLLRGQTANILATDATGKIASALLSCN
jgi:hypothetical protein